MMSTFYTSYLSVLAFGLTLSCTANANPVGGNVVGGSATITENSTQLDIHQHSTQAIIDWRSFDIDRNESTIIRQPSSNAILLNRITGSDPSKIFGNLTANGNVVLVNPNGVIFGPNSVVDVNGLIATTSNIRNDDFMSGNLTFSESGNPTSSIINQGTITAKEAGLVTLVAPNVANFGVIQANLGRVELASGDAFTVDLYGDGLYELKVSDDVASQLVRNAGRITTEGGTIAITAAAGETIVNSLISIEGELKAPSIEQRAGKIIISAAGTNSVAGNVTEDKGKKAGYSGVIIGNAHLDASGRNKGEQGGEITITADVIDIAANTVIDASGDAPSNLTPQSPDQSDQSEGTATMTADKKVRDEASFLAHESRAGGSIKIGGDYLGKGDTATALYVHIDEEAYLINDAITSGDAGRTIVWSDDKTEFYGNVFARGGRENGNGGFLETSGKQTLNALGYADLSNRVDGYNKGTYLLDPADIAIYGNVDPRFTSSDSSIDLASDLQLWLDASDASKIELNYSETIGVTGSGTIGTNTITTSADISGDLVVGSRIRLGAEGAITVATTLGPNTYTISALSGTTITFKETLTETYTAQDLRLGIATTWYDKSGNNNHAVQNTVGAAGLWVENGQNNQATILFNNDDFYRLPDGTIPAGNSNYSTFFALQGSRGGIAGSGNYGTPIGVNAFRYLETFEGKGFRHYWWAADVDFQVGNIIDNPHLASFIYDNTTGRSGYLNAALMGSDTITGRNSGTGNNTIGVTNNGEYLNGSLYDITIYNDALSSDARDLVNQYQSAKWDITLTRALTDTGTGTTEAEQAMAADGYSAFTTRYLERLSKTADIVLQADNSITLDLQGDTLSLDADRSLTLTTTTGNITDVSSGTIVTTQTGSGGNITLNAGGAIALDSTNLEALNGGLVNLAANDTIDVSQVSTLNIGTLSSNSNQAINLTSSGIIRFNTALTLQETLTASASSDLILNADIATSSALANAIQLSSASRFINNAGSDALNTSNSNWAVYSNDFSNNTRGGLQPDESLFGQANITTALSNATANKNILAYASATRPTLTYTIEDTSVKSGDALTNAIIHYTSGLENGDLEGTIGMTGTHLLNTRYTTSTRPGFYANALDATTGTLFNVLGYQYNFIAGDLTVTGSAVTAETSVPSTVERESQSANRGSTVAQEETNTQPVQTPSYSLEKNTAKVKDEMGVNTVSNNAKSTRVALITAEPITVKQETGELGVTEQKVIRSGESRKSLSKNAINRPNAAPTQLASIGNGLNNVFNSIQPESKTVSDVYDLSVTEFYSASEIHSDSLSNLTIDKRLPVKINTLTQAQLAETISAVTVDSTFIVANSALTTGPTLNATSVAANSNLTAVNKIQPARWYDGLLFLLEFWGIALASILIPVTSFFLFLFRPKTMS